MHLRNLYGKHFDVVRTRSLPKTQALYGNKLDIKYVEKWRGRAEIKNILARSLKYHTLFLCYPVSTFKLVGKCSLGVITKASTTAVLQSGPKETGSWHMRVFSHYGVNEDEL